MMNKPNPTLLTRQQQINLRAGHHVDTVLDETQKRHLAWRKRLLGEVLPEFNAPSAYLYALHDDGALTLMFPVKTLAPQWCFHCYVHPDNVHYKSHVKSRSKQLLAGCVSPRKRHDQNDGLLADIHLIADHISELVLVHELIHAAGYLSRVLLTLEAKALAAPFCQSSQSALMWREEIQCRTVEFAIKQILPTLRALEIPCERLRYAEL